ncbi:hypothetical protein [Streptomyces canus]|uniref:hypothetical protein n=1 Tax=Streptomyces canus TaxID=58343 RepID=UPI002B1DB5B8|nr:hypothetical protein [Streptomyces canus]
MLLDDLDVAIYTSVLGRQYVVHLLPVILRELDDKRLGGRTPDLREAAKKADRRLKGAADQRQRVARRKGAR